MYLVMCYFRVFDSLTLPVFRVWGEMVCLVVVVFGGFRFHWFSVPLLGSRNAAGCKGIGAHALPSELCRSHLLYVTIIRFLFLSVGYSVRLDALHKEELFG